MLIPAIPVDDIFENLPKIYPWSRLGTSVISISLVPEIIVFLESFVNSEPSNF